MSDPVAYTIVRDLQAALQAIRLSSQYHHTIGALAVRLDPDADVEALIAPEGPRPFVLIDVKPETREYLPANEMRLVLPVTIFWVSESISGDDDSRLLTYYQGCADVERAIAVDTTRGGRAVDTRITGCTLDPSHVAAEVWAVIDLEIPFYRQFGQPNAG
jgi:hypothetical protein